MTATSLGPSTNQIQPYLPDLVLFTKMVRFRLPFQNMIFRGNIQCVKSYQANEAVRSYRDTHNTRVMWTYIISTWIMGALITELVENK